MRSSAPECSLSSIVSTRQWTSQIVLAGLTPWQFPKALAADTARLAVSWCEEDCTGSFALPINGLIDTRQRKQSSAARSRSRSGRTQHQVDRKPTSRRHDLGSLVRSAVMNHRSASRASAKSASRARPAPSPTRSGTPPAPGYVDFRCGSKIWRWPRRYLRKLTGETELR